MSKKLFSKLVLFFILIIIPISETTDEDNFLVTNCQCRSKKTKVKIACKTTIGAIIMINDLVYRPLGEIFFNFLNMGMSIFILN